MTKEFIRECAVFELMPFTVSKLLALALLFLLVAPARGNAAMRFTADYPIYDVAPASGIAGNEHTIVLLLRDPNEPNRRDITDKSRLVPPVGITVTGLTPTSTNSLTARISIPKGAPLGKYRFLLKDKESPKEGLDDSKVIGIADFEVTIAPGPIPPGLTPQVDVMWGVMSKDVVHHNFGRKIAANYYGIQIRIGNDSGFDLQIAGVGFRLPASAGIKNIVPANSYRSTRGTLEREQEVGLRATVLNSVKALGSIYTGLLPFWKVPNRKENATLWGAIVNGPVVAGLESVFPDTTIRQLTRLDDQTLRDGLIIKNNSQVATLAWVPRKLLSLSSNSGRTDLDNPRKTEPVKNWHDDPLYVNRKLGELVIVGQAIAYLNRVQVINTSEGSGVTPPPSVLGTDVQAAKQGDEPTIVFTGEHLEGASITGPAGIEFPSANTTVDKNGHVLRAKAVISKDLRAATYVIYVSTSGGRSNPLSLRIDAAPPKIIATTTAPTTIKVTDKDQDVSITITGEFLKDSKLAPTKVENVLELKGETKATFTEVKQTLTVLANAKKGEYNLELQAPGGKAPIKIKLE